MNMAAIINNANHGLVNLAASGGVFTPATSHKTSIFATGPKGSEIGQLFVRATASAAVSIATDAIYILGHDTAESTGVRLKQFPDDTAPFNILTGWDGQTQIDDVVPFRLPRFVSVEFYSSDSGVTFTLSGALSFTCVA